MKATAATRTRMRVKLQPSISLSRPSQPPPPTHPPVSLFLVSRRARVGGEKPSPYKSRFVENKNHFWRRIARLRAIDGRSGSSAHESPAPSRRRERVRDEAYRGFEWTDFHQRGGRGFFDPLPRRDSYTRWTDSLLSSLWTETRFEDCSFSKILLAARAFQTKQRRKKFGGWKFNTQGSAPISGRVLRLDAQPPGNTQIN